MAKVIYYHDGRGVVELRGKTAGYIKDSLSTALALVRDEALEQQHWGAQWTLGPNTAFTHCLTCGQTAVITKLPCYLVVDSYLHTTCQPTDRRLPDRRLPDRRLPQQESSPQRPMEVRLPERRLAGWPRPQSRALVTNGS